MMTKVHWSVATNMFIVFLFWELACILPVVTILVKILFIFWRDIIKICAYNK